MSKVSVFKFNIINNEQNINNINVIIQNYLSSRGFFYNNEKGCYTTGTPTKKNQYENIALTVLSGGTTIFYSVQHGFEYYIWGNQLIIKAYTIKNNAKNSIHSTFDNSKYYFDLKNSLFIFLNNNNITLQSKEVEKINDGVEAKFFKTFLIITLIMFALVFLIMYISFQ